MVLLQTRLGQLRGQTKQSVISGKSYYSFQGIPFGKPPLGELRFKAPQPYGSWQGVRDALDVGNDPKQPNMLPAFGLGDPSKVADGDEDCLYLNVYLNQLPEGHNTKKPVMFNIHGGGFACGSGNPHTLGPDLQLEADVVFVSFNYRTGAFGFLSLEDKEACGNAGIKDQLLALQWVHDNIDSFGGDPDNITILGISGGGASVHYHLISRASKGLFHKAIVQSGFASNLWAFDRTPRLTALKLARKLGCTFETNAEIFKFLQSVPADDIVVATKAIAKDKELFETATCTFRPCVEVSEPGAFLTDTPDNIMARGEMNDVPVIIGICSREGNLIQAVGLLNEEEFQRANESPELLVPSFLGLTDGSAKKKEVQKSIWKYYFKDQPLSWDNVNEYIEYRGDVLFNIGMETARNSLIENSSSPVFTYLFTNHSMCFCHLQKDTFKPTEYFSKVFTSDTCHGADCQYLNYADLFGFKYTVADIEASKKYVKAWTDFAAAGDPSYKGLKPVWKRDSVHKPCFMDIGTNWTVREGRMPFADRVQFWEELRSKYCKV